MIPANFYRVTTFLLNDNGKIDEKAMINWICEKEQTLALEQHDNGPKIENDDITERIVDMIYEVLEKENERIDLDKSYNEVGFDSLSFIKFTVMLEDYFNVELDLDFLIPDETTKIIEIVDDIKSYIVGN